MTFRYLILIIVLLSNSIIAHAEYTQCKSDDDCKSMGSAAYCRPQRIGCPGKEATSTCVIQVCDKGPEATRMADFVKSCKVDGDCQVILHKCHCMYCARPEDERTGIASAVNKMYATDLDKRAKCSVEEKKICAAAGACAQIGTSVPVCQDNVCRIRFEPRKK
jgi:hypothetical protein